MEIFLQTIGALNDATRLQILRFIQLNGEVCVCEIEASFNMIQSRISRHLKILKDAGFLRVNRRGKWAYYAIRTPLDRFRLECLEELSYLDIPLPLKPLACNENL
ncbi:ArsR/SmtB family transcription factor [Sulfurospirillum deleyianum]|uniref:Regulatory protein ArsR n=1 Tax=Sulfurospirillum deleyianum (strain ATCC 51133 / DSM 6946 / 5175) TaxID=525898 RepID=D1B373_SULD5|nr:metalloregulator ArsR/SmtB family transcription factor [Sulfurospirillum deleyianum]ACZ12543.1 regulatory protein ArsR [Sulfurospirillum deleyianum DSM 6946]